jgi:hypothetical protein
VFPEDTDVPIAAVALIWKQNEIETRDNLARFRSASLLQIAPTGETIQSLVNCGDRFPEAAAMLHGEHSRALEHALERRFSHLVVNDVPLSGDDRKSRGPGKDTVL